MERGLIFDIQRFSVHDGPGIRTTVFLKGCPLACAWCHNPEGQGGEPQIVTLEHRCLRCGACRQVCPREGTEERAPRCTTCGRCVAACPTGARQRVGTVYDTAQLITELQRDRCFYEESGGGVTFCGGEPLAQTDFLEAALTAARAAELHTAVDTCGYAPAAKLEAIARWTDLFLYDLKLVDDQRHQRYTGVSNHLILENLRMLAREHGSLWVRVPVIPGVNDDDSAIGAVAELLAGLPRFGEVHLLPYHETGERKFARLGRDYGLTGVKPPSRERLGELLAILTGAGLNARIAG